MERITRREACGIEGHPRGAIGRGTQGSYGVLAVRTRIDDPTRQKTFLENVLENARTLSLARQWFGEPRGP
jgi:hypothetical protein